jgi:hypothetical protein
MKILAGFLLLLIPSVDFASDSCFEPSAPSCISLALGNPDAFCEREVHRYMQDVNDYISCLLEAIRSDQLSIDDAKSESKKILKKWNCWVHHEAFCL